MITNTYNKLTRRGKVMRVMKEHYLRDDIGCGMEQCNKCSSFDDSLSLSNPLLLLGGRNTNSSASSSSSAYLSREPLFQCYLVLDTNTVLHQMDVLEAGQGLFDDMIIPQTVLEETKHRNLNIYNRLYTLIQTHPRRIVSFANHHHRETYSIRRPGETANDYNDRLIRELCVWLKYHFEDNDLSVLLLTHDTANKQSAVKEGIVTYTVQNYIQYRLKDTKLKEETKQKYSRLLELVALPSNNAIESNDHNVVTVPPPSSALEAEAATILTSSKNSFSSSTASSVNRSSSTTNAGIYREHLSQQQLSEGIKSRRMFQGVLRVNRDCWYEARVMIHGIQGKGGGGENKNKETGGDDALAVLIVGRESINRGMDGDTVVIEVLPEEQWKHPSSRLALPPVQTQDEDKLEKEQMLLDNNNNQSNTDTVTVSSTTTISSQNSSNTNTASRTQLQLIASAASSANTGSVPTGRVIGIQKRAWRPLCGSLEPEEQLPGVAADGSKMMQTALFVPVDTRYPRIRIDTRQKWSLMDKRLVVALDSWDAHSRYPRGHYVRTIGVIGDKATENEVILLEHDIISRPFSSDVIACLPPANWEITPENSKNRRDLRHIDIMSIDPPGCKDIDDALHARLLSNGDVEVGVHIADVSFFVHHGTAIDIEAALRANTTYLVERRLDMLPGLLTETLCSLKGNVDRFAFSVIWRFRRVNKHPLPSGYDKLAPEDRWEIVPDSAEYFKSIIHSRAALTYAAAQALLDDKTAQTPVANGVKLLASIARSLRRRRIEAGALALASAEVKFLLDSETHEPLDVMAYEMRETNSTVEEFMLLGNIAVAERIVKSYPRCSLLRRHPAPPKSAFNSLIAAAKAVGVELNINSSKELADSLDRAVVVDNPYFNRLLRILTTRCMMQATYFPSGETTPQEYHHYGLAAPIYTHFTSPIRRYADVVVHRLLAAALGIDPLPKDYEDKTIMKAECDNMNRRHLMSQLAGRASGSLHTNIFFQNRIIIETGVVLKVRANGVVILIPRFGIEGSIILGRNKDDIRLVTNDNNTKGTTSNQRTVVYDEENQLLYDILEPDTVKVRIFQEVKIALNVEEKARHRKELVYRIVDPPFDKVPDAKGTSGSSNSKDNTTIVTSTTNTLSPSTTKRSASETEQKTISSSKRTKI